MGLSNLERLLSPSSIAVVGASDREKSIGRSLLENFRDGGFPGAVYPINPKRDNILGLKAYPSLSDVKQPIDMAVIMTRITTVPDIIRECVALGIGGAVIISSGGKEAGEEGRKIEAEIKKEADRGSVRIVGPNCIGVLNTRAKMNASFGHVLPKAGNLAFVSQSGGTTTAVLDVAVTEDIGFSYFISVGSMLDVDFGDIIEYLGDDPHTTGILLYAESITNHGKFLNAARNVTKRKPIVLLKVGRSAVGAKAAQSHTGALAGEDDVYDAAFSRAGIIRVDTLNQLFDCADMMAKQPLPKSPNLAIVTNTGGPGVMAADCLAFHGIDLPALSDSTMEKLNGILSPFWSHGNPVDILGDAPPEVFRQAALICANAEEFDALLIMNTPQAQVPSTDRARVLCEGLKDINLPVFSSWIGTEEVYESRNLFRKAGIPTYDSPERAVRAFLYMYQYRQYLDTLHEWSSGSVKDIQTNRVKSRSIIEKALNADRYLLTETESKELLDCYGIPVTATKRAATSDQAVELAEEMGYPVVLKLDSQDISHKSDAGGVMLNLVDKREVHEAFKEILSNARAYDARARISGVTVQPMVRTDGHELILGVKKDPDFGPVLLFGMGGITAELIRDRVIALPPLDRLLARRMIESTKVYKLLQGFRGLPGADIGILEEILVRLSQLVIDFPEIVELDVNPLIAHEKGAVSLDARVVIERATVPAPDHLALRSMSE